MIRMRTNWPSVRRVWIAMVPAFLLAVGAGCKPSDPAKAPARAASANTPVPITVAEAVSMPVDRTLPVVGTLYAKDEATVGA